MSSAISFASLVSWDNLLLAFRKAAKGKRGRPPAAQFEHQVADKLIALQRTLLDRTYTPGAYRHFFIREPKRRKISAAPFRDRVVHHALCNLIEPLFDARFIPNSYANRSGKGTHAAIDRLQSFSRRYPYVLRVDVVKHFPSLDHAILYHEIERVVRDEGLLWLSQLILDSGRGILRDEYRMVYFPHDDLFAVNRPRGLPIGNLTSQFWSNVYLNPFDWFVKRELGCSAYLRYVDDFALFSDSKAQLYEWKQALIERLARLRLTIHHNEAQVIPVREGISWLGFVVYPDYRRLKRRNTVNFTRRLGHNMTSTRPEQLALPNWMPALRAGLTMCATPIHGVCAVIFSVAILLGCTPNLKFACLTRAIAFTANPDTQQYPLFRAALRALRGS